MTSLNVNYFMNSALNNKNVENVPYGVYPLLRPKTYAEVTQQAKLPLLINVPELKTIEDVKKYAVMNGPVLVNNADSKAIVYPTGDIFVLQK